MRTLLTVLVLMMTISAYGQWKIGPSVSYGYVMQKKSDIPVIPMQSYALYDMEYIGSTNVTSVGFMFYNDLGPVFLQAGLLATTYGLDFMISGYKRHG